MSSLGQLKRVEENTASLLASHGSHVFPEAFGGCDDRVNQFLAGLDVKTAPKKQ
jgi:hypothetical protein